MIVGRVGADGDGVTEDGLYVPYALPGETITVDRTGSRGVLREILTPSPDRVPPPCPHFGACGGCALQHWAETPYTEWKAAKVASALASAGFAVPVIASLRTPPHSRRRIELAIARDGPDILLGLHQRRGTAVVDMRVCTVVRPALLALIGALRPMIRQLAALRRSGSVLINGLDTGPDLLLRTDGALTPADRATLAGFAEAQRVPRIAWARDRAAPEIAAQIGSVGVAFAGVRVEPPPGAFLQASAEGEAAIVTAVLAGLPEKLTARARVVELFAGVGTLSFPLSGRARVAAFEADAAAVAAVRRGAGGRPIEATARDLVRQPLTPKELTGAAIVLDPPYAGAAAQMPAIAATGARVVYVSCNPTSLGRDAAVLRQAGYRLVAATAIDQFLWSAEVECVAVFAR